MSKQKLSPTNINVSKKDSCLFCSCTADPIRIGRTSASDSIILDDGDETAKVLKALCNHMMPENQDDIPDKFSPEMFPFCLSCKNLVRQLWGCQEVIRKAQFRVAEIKTIIEKKVLDGMILDGQMPSSSAGTSSEKRFLKLRHVIFENYREGLLLLLMNNKNEKLLSVPSVPTTSDHGPAVLQIVSTSTLLRLPVTKECDADDDEVASNYCADADTILPEVPPSPKDSSESCSQAMEDDDSDPNFEEEYHMLKAEMSSECEMGGEGDDDNSENIESEGEEGDKIVTSPSPSLSQSFAPSGRVKRRTERKADVSLTEQRKESRPKSNIKRGKKIANPERTKYTKLKNGKVKCGCCNHIFSTIYNYHRHVTEKRKEYHPCDACCKIFTSTRALSTHKYEIHGAGRNEKFPCPHCGSQFTRASNLKTHLSKNRCKGGLEGGSQ